MTRWYRAYEGTVTDAKLGEAALVAGCSRSVAIAAWHCILESCATANDKGRFDATARRIAVILGEPVSTIEAILSELEQLAMIEGQVVTAWSRRQFESDSSTERSKKHRQHKRDAGATLQQRDATPPETETDTHSEKIEPSLRSGSARKRSPAKRKTPIAEDEQPNDAQKKIAAEFALSVPEFRLEWAKFRSSNIARGTLFSDWVQAWRNWLLKRPEFTSNQPRAGPSRANPRDGLAESFREISSRRENDEPRQHQIAATGDVLGLPVIPAVERPNGFDLGGIRVGLKQFP